ncbi:MAG: NUDIX hydrolase [Bacteroidota bacterium]
MNYKISKSDSVFDGVVFDIKVDEIIYESGNIGRREVVLHNGGAVVVPVTKEGKVVFVKQFRYPLQQWLLELPAGKLDKGEDPLVCAKRELTEESGYTSNNIKKLGAIFTSPGFCTEELHIFLATDLMPGNHNREEGEYGMEVFEFSLEEVRSKIVSGEITDAKSICGIQYLELNKS